MKNNKLRRARHSQLCAGRSCSSLQLACSTALPVRSHCMFQTLWCPQTQWIHALVSRWSHREKSGQTKTRIMTAESQTAYGADSIHIITWWTDTKYYWYSWKKKNTEKPTLRRRCSVCCSEFPCIRCPRPSHNKSTAGWGHWQRPKAQGNRWKGTWGCPGAFDLVRFVRALDGSWQWKGRWSVRSWRCWRWQTGPPPAKSDATFPRFLCIWTRCTIKECTNKYYNFTSNSGWDFFYFL